MASKKTVTISVTPVSGNKPQDKEVEIESTGSSVEEVLAKASMKLDANVQVFVDGEPGDRRTHVKPGGKISFTEKVRGS